MYLKDEIMENVFLQPEAEAEPDFSIGGVFGAFKPTDDIEIGRIKRTVPIGEWLLNDPSVQALKRNLDEMGITAVMPTVYQNRLKRNVQKGLVTPDGAGFTDKGKEIAVRYLEAKGLDAEKAMQKASTATAIKFDTKRAEKASGMKFAFGYKLDSSGRAKVKGE